MSEHPMSFFLDRYPPQNDPERERDSAGCVEPPRSPRKLPVEATLDLHGYTREEAAREIDRFIAASLQQGMRKVLFVHGKGLHGEGDAPLRNLTLSILADHPLVGTTGTPGARLGGTGATWAVLRQRSR